MPVNTDDIPTKLDDYATYIAAKTFIEFKCEGIQAYIHHVDPKALQEMGQLLLSAPLYVLILAEEAAFHGPRYKGDRGRAITATMAATATKIATTGHIVGAVGTLSGLSVAPLTLTFLGSELMKRMTDDWKNPYDYDTDNERWCHAQAGYYIGRTLALPAVALSFISEKAAQVVTDPDGTELFLDQLCQDIIDGKFKDTNIEDYSRAELRTLFINFLHNYLETNGKEILKNHKALPLYIAQARQAFRKYIGIKNNRLIVLQKPQVRGLPNEPQEVTTNQVTTLAQIFDDYQAQVQKAVQEHVRRNPNALTVYRDNTQPLRIPGNLHIHFTSDGMRGISASFDLLNPRVDDQITVGLVLVISLGYSWYQWAQKDRIEKTFHYIKEFSKKKGKNSGLLTILKDDDHYTSRSLRKCFEENISDRTMTLICASCLYLIKHGKASNYYREWSKLDFSKSIPDFLASYHQHATQFFTAMESDNKLQACISASRMHEEDPAHPLTWLAAGLLMEKYRIVNSTKRDVYITKHGVWNFECKQPNNYPTFELYHISDKSKLAYEKSEEYAQNWINTLQTQLSNLSDIDSDAEKESLQNSIDSLNQTKTAATKAKLNLLFRVALGDFSSPRPNASRIHTNLTQLIKSINNLYGVSDVSYSTLFDCYNYLQDWQSLLGLHTKHFGISFNTLSPREKIQRAKLMHQMAQGTSSPDTATAAMDILFSELASLKQDENNLFEAATYFFYHGEGGKAEKCFLILFETNRKNHAIQRYLFGSLLLQGKLSDTKKFLNEIGPTPHCEPELKAAYNYINRPDQDAPKPPHDNDADNDLTGGSNDDPFLFPSQSPTPLSAGLDMVRTSFFTTIAAGLALKIATKEGSSIEILPTAITIALISGLCTAGATLCIGETFPRLSTICSSAPLFTWGMNTSDPVTSTLVLTGGLGARALPQKAFC